MAVKKKTVRTKRKSKNARVRGKQAAPARQNDKNRWFKGIIMILAGIYCYYAFTTAIPNILDKIIGKYILMYLFGNTVPILCIVLIVSGILLMTDKLAIYKDTIMYVLLINLSFMVLLSIYIPLLTTNYKIVDLFSLAAFGGYGGILGIIPAFLLDSVIGTTPTLIITFILIFVELAMIVKINFPNIFERAKNDGFGTVAVKNKILDMRDDMIEKKAQKVNYDDLVPEEDKTPEPDTELYSVDDSDGLIQRQGKTVSVDTEVLDFIDDVNEELGLANRPTREEKAPFDVDMNSLPEELVSTPPNVQVDKLLNISSEQKKKPVIEQTAYKFPSAELLTLSKAKDTGFEKEITANASRIRETLKNFGVDAVIRGYQRGPSITRYEIKPAPGVKVSKIVNLADDLALALATSGIRIEAPIPGKDAVGIEVPNKKSNIVHIRDIIDTPEFKDTSAAIPFALGKTLSGKNIIGDIASMPHLLIAGATGSGKSVCINAIIISLLYQRSPEDLRMIMIDPKMVELNQYNDVPHLLVPVVTDPRKAAGALNWAIGEMTKRYEQFKDTGVRDIDSYNLLMEKQNGEHLPRIVIVIDELADLMMTSPKEVEAAICRIAQLARACGIHLIIATQRPSVDVITGLIKSNIPSRIAFSVASNTDSRTILDTAGAEKLLGKGDMLYDPVGLSKPLRVQCCYVSDAEITRVIAAVHQDSEPDYDEGITETIETAGEPTEQKETKKDKLFDQAVEIAFSNGQLSTSMLQRRLGIGYARAGRLIDSMEQSGLISGPNGSKPRKLLLTEEEYRTRS